MADTRLESLDESEPPGNKGKSKEPPGSSFSSIGCARCASDVLLWGIHRQGAGVNRGIILSAICCDLHH